MSYVLFICLIYCRCIRLDPVWGDFYGARAVGSTPVPFLEAFPLTLWVQPPCLSPKFEAFNRNLKYGDMTVLCHVPNLISLQINHFQYLFLLRVADAVDEVSILLTRNCEYCECIKL